jgi:8-oxo-dGTP diphosphatase
VHVLYLLRHADAGDKRRWPGPDALRPLSPAGRRQADALVARLRGHPIARILSSPAVRCRDTVAPLARQRGLPLEEAGALAVDADPVALLALAAAPDGVLAAPNGGRGNGAATVLCTHGELIGRVLDQLAAGGTAVPVAPAWPKGSTWILRGGHGRLAVAGYLPPPDVG